jgi:hypothetical protein
MASLDQINQAFAAAQAKVDAADAIVRKRSAELTELQEQFRALSMVAEASPGIAVSQAREANDNRDLRALSLMVQTNQLAAEAARADVERAEASLDAAREVLLDAKQGRDRAAVDLLRGLDLEAQAGVSAALDSLAAALSRSIVLYQMMTHHGGHMSGDAYMRAPPAVMYGRAGKIAAHLHGLPLELRPEWARSSGANGFNPAKMPQVADALTELQRQFPGVGQ